MGKPISFKISKSCIELPFWSLNYRVKSLLSGYKTTCPCLESNCLCIPGQGTPRDLSEDGFLWCSLKRLLSRNQPYPYMVRARSSWCPCIPYTVSVFVVHIGLAKPNLFCCAHQTRVVLRWRVWNERNRLAVTFRRKRVQVKWFDWQVHSITNVCGVVVVSDTTWIWDSLDGSTCAVLAFRDPSLCQTFVKPSRCR